MKTPIVASRAFIKNRLGESSKLAHRDMHAKFELIWIFRLLRAMGVVQSFFPFLPLMKFARVFLQEIGAVSKVSKKDIGKFFKQIVQTLEPSMEFIQSGDYVSRFCSNLGLSPTIQLVGLSEGRLL